ncbi:MAG: MFS transporter [Hamadaea sp.]|nr:MFS transporter [Hamadaea sp.]
MAQPTTVETAPPERPERASSSYARVLRTPGLRRILPGVAVSALGDGMSLVAVAWLALQIVPPDRAAVWTGLAVAAYSLPASLGAVVFARLVRRLNGAALLAVDASLRAVVLGAVAALAVADALNPAAYVALLAVSSLLHAWGSAGAYTMVAETLLERDQVAGNALISTFSQAALIVGPALAGFLAGVAGPGWVIAGDAASFAVLAVCAWPLARRTAGTRRASTGTPGTPWRALAARPQLLLLILLTCALYFLYGPVEVALPVHVAQGLHAPAAVLGTFWAVFSVGAVAGALLANRLQRLPLWYVVAAIFAGWGLALVPVGVSDQVWLGMAGFAFGGVVYGPFNALSTALVQRTAPPELLSGVLAARSALLIPSVAVGTLLGGPLVAWLGGQRTLLFSGLFTVLLGVLIAAYARTQPSSR